MSDDVSPGPGWRRSADGEWYPPRTHVAAVPAGDQPPLPALPLPASPIGEEGAATSSAGPEAAAVPDVGVPPPSKADRDRNLRRGALLIALVIFILVSSRISRSADDGAVATPAPAPPVSEQTRTGAAVLEHNAGPPELAGSPANPFAYDAEVSLHGSVQSDDRSWIVSVSEPINMTQQGRAIESRRPGFVHVGVEVEVTFVSSKSPEAISPGSDFTVRLENESTNDQLPWRAAVTSCTDPRFEPDGLVSTGETVSGVACFVAAEDDVDNLHVVVESATGERVHFGLDGIADPLALDEPGSSG